MQEIQAPHPIPSEGRLLFLAGSIEMGRAEEWQREICARLAETEWIILNPRRASWDASWQQSVRNPLFKEQVEWELEALERADKVLMYFDPETKSPISLLELGLYARSGKLIVVCPDGFWKNANVEIVCKKYGIPQVETLKAALKELLENN